MRNRWQPVAAFEQNISGPCCQFHDMLGPCQWSHVGNAIIPEELQLAVLQISCTGHIFLQIDVDPKAKRYLEFVIETGQLQIGYTSGWLGVTADDCPMTRLPSLMAAVDGLHRCARCAGDSEVIHRPSKGRWAW